MKTYAYVTTECCRIMDAAKPGSFIGRDEVPVSKHGDYAPWTMGKRETLRMIESRSMGPFMPRAARAVAELLGWE